MRSAGWVVHYAYDALGRLINRQVPWNAARTFRRNEAYYYDGVRRIQEVFSDPMAGGGPVSVTVGGGGGGGSSYRNREYVHSPGYVDEHVCQFDRFGAVSYVLQDANYNVVGLVNPSGQVLAQYTYDPYGEVLVADVLAAHADNRLGHQGLFFDRFSGFAGQGGYRTLTPGQGAAGAYQGRNRTYMPSHGRWAQPDPSASGQPVLADLAFHGTAPEHAIQTVGLAALYADGLSRYAFVGGRPLVRTDPSGLSMFDPLSDAASTAMRYGQAYDQAKGLLDIAKSLAAGASIESAMVGFAFDLVADKAGGRLLDKALDGIGGLRRKIAAGHGPRPPPK